MRIRHLVLLTLLIFPFCSLRGSTLTITKGGTGEGYITVNGMSRTLPYSHAFPAGTHLTVQAVPETGSKFDNWTGSGMSGTTNPFIFDMPAIDVNATANFTKLDPDIASDPTSWNFGSVATGGYSNKSITLTNGGDGILHVTSTTITGTNASEFHRNGAWSDITLAPGETSRQISYSFKPTSTGSKSASVSIASDDPDVNPFTIPLSGTGVAGHNLTVSQEGSGTGNVSINDWSWSLPFTWAYTRGFHLKLEATASAGSRFDYWSGNYVVSGTNLMEFNMPAYDISVAAHFSELQPDIASDPVSWNYGSIATGGISVKTFIVSNAGTADLSGTSTTITGTNASEFSIQSGAGAFTLTPGATHNITVRFSPTSAGSKSATLSITSNDPDENPFFIALTGAGSGGGDTFSIVVDGVKDNFYSQLKGPGDGFLQLRYYAWNENGKPANDSDLSVNIWTAWDKTWFYLYEEVKDDTLRGNSSDIWAEDELELKFDPQPTDSLTNSVFDTRLTALGMGTAGVVAADNMNYIPTAQKQWVRTTTADGYILELAIKWTAIISGSETISPAINNIFGIAINQHDNDKGYRQATVQWAAVLSDQVWNTPKYLGMVKFLADHRLQFIPTNHMTGVTNPVPYDGTPTYDRTGDHQATITFTVSVPANTPAADHIYIAGNFNFWDPGPGQAGTDGLEHDVLMNLTGTNQRQIALSFASGQVLEYKYTRGSWNKVEKGAGGEDIANRTLAISATNGEENDVVASWADIGTGIADKGMNEATAFQLFQNYPNPFNPSTQIRYALPRDEQVKLEVYDAKGVLVMILADERQQAGYHSIAFQSVGLTSGVYFCRLRAGAFTMNSKMLLIR